MVVFNDELNRLEEKRDKVRKEVSNIMRSTEYYKNNDLYERVKALTGLEVYLSYRIEVLKEKLESMTYGENLV